MTEYALLREAIGENADTVLKKGIRAVIDRF